MASKKFDKLEELLKATDTKQEFDIVADLQSLERLYGVLKTKDYRKKLRALVVKYEQDELTEIRKTVVEKCRAEDLNAIRLYKEYFAPTEATAEDDGLIDVLSKRATEVFTNE